MLDRSGYTFVNDGSAAVGEAIEELVVQVANGHKTFDEIEAWMKANVAKRRRTQGDADKPMR